MYPEFLRYGFKITGFPPASTGLQQTLQCVEGVQCAQLHYSLRLHKGIILSISNILIPRDLLRAAV